MDIEGPLIPDNEEREVIKLRAEFFRTIEEITENRCKSLTNQIPQMIYPVSSWGERALKYQRREIMKETLNEIGVDNETKEFVLGSYN